MSSTTLKSLFAYKAWANAELYAKLATLPPEHAEALNTCIRTLNHIYVVDRIFRAHLAGESRPFDATNTRELPALAQLHAKWDEKEQARKQERQRAIQALQHAEQRSLLAAQISRDIFLRPQIGKVPDEVSRFLLGPWAQVMAQARLTDASRSAVSATGPLGPMSLPVTRTEGTCWI